MEVPLILLLMVPLAARSQAGAPTPGERGLRIHIEFVDSAFSPDIREEIRHAVGYMSQVVRLKYDDVGPVFRLPRDVRACVSLYAEGPNVGKCAGVSARYTGDYCGKALIPEAHLEGLKVFSKDGPACNSNSLPEGKGFRDGTNFVLYVMSSSDSFCSYSHALASTCRYSTALVGGEWSGRPLAGTVKLCRDRMYELTPLLLKRVIIHEVIHLLGFNYRSIMEFIECDEEADPRPSPLGGGDENFLCWKRRDVLKVIGEKEIIVQSPQLTAAALRLQEYLNQTINCSSYNRSFSAEESLEHIFVDEQENYLYDNDTFEENGNNPLVRSGGIALASTRTGIHWPVELFSDTFSVMTPGSLESKTLVVDPLTTAVLKTSGWYRIDEIALSCINCFLNDMIAFPKCIYMENPEDKSMETVDSESVEDCFSDDESSKSEKDVILQDLSPAVSDDSISRNVSDEVSEEKNETQIWIDKIDLEITEGKSKRHRKKKNKRKRKQKKLHNDNILPMTSKAAHYTQSSFILYVLCFSLCR